MRVSLTPQLTHSPHPKYARVHTVASDGTRNHLVHVNAFSSERQLLPRPRSALSLRGEETRRCQSDQRQPAQQDRNTQDVPPHLADRAKHLASLHPQPPLSLYPTPRLSITYLVHVQDHRCPCRRKRRRRGRARLHLLAGQAALRHGLVPCAGWKCLTLRQQAHS